jgi:nicotinamide-nucleotide amidase
MKKNTLLKHIAHHCIASSQMIAVAESCTGGLLAADLTKLPGSSMWFDRGFVTYSNAAKQTLLGVSEKTLAQYGAVSHEIVQAMAEGALKNSQAQIALAITGIAGPTGGTFEKPVGTVWFAVVSKKHAAVTYVKKFEGSRDKVRKQAVNFALGLLYEEVKNG